MKKQQIAAQLYTVRDQCKTAEGLRDTCLKLRDIGYRSVQVSGIGPIPFDEVKAITREAGMSICCTHTGFDAICDRTDEVVAQHRLYETTDIGVGCMPGEYWGSYESQMAFARQMVDAAKKLKEYGLDLAYHNHAFEFTRFPEGVPFFDMAELFMENGVNFILDLYWLQAGGVNPAEWIRKLAGHVNVVHFKDMTVIDNRTAMAEVGEGNMNWHEMVQACDEAGVKWAAVEQDTCQRHPIESLAISYRNLASIL